MRILEFRVFEVILIFWDVDKDFDNAVIIPNAPRYLSISFPQIMNPYFCRVLLPCLW